MLEGGVHRIEVAVVLQQVDGCFRANPAHAGDVVGAVTGEGLEVHHLVGHHAELAEHPFFADQCWATAFGVGAATHVEHRDVAAVIHQLEQVAVSRKDPHAPSRVGRSVRQGSQHIVGFVARCHAEGELQVRFEDLLQLFEVLEEHLRGHIPVGLVVGVRLVAEGGLGCVEGDGNALWLQGFAVVQQGFEKAVGHAGGPAVFGGQTAFPPLAEGVEAAECQGMAIHKQQKGLGGGLGHDGVESVGGSIAAIGPWGQIDEHAGS